MSSLPVRVVVALLAGSVLFLLPAPYHLHYLHWFALVPMFWVVREDTPGHNRVLGGLYGTIGVALIFSWIVDTIVLFSNIPAILAAGILLLFSLAFGLLPYLVLWSMVHPLRKRFGLWWIVLFPAFWVCIEYLEMYLLLFPYSHGVSQYVNLATWQLSSVTGVWGPAYLVILVNSALAEQVYRVREGKKILAEPVCAAVSLTCLVTLGGAWRYEHVEATLREAPTVRIAQIQSKNGMTERFEMGARKAFAEWVNLTRQIRPGTVDLVVWPEGSCPYHLNEGRAPRFLGQMAREGGYEMVVGAGTRERAPHTEQGEKGKVSIFNSVYFFESDGKVQGWYSKMVPLPFGEYIPFADTFPWLRDLIQGPGQFEAGDTPVVFEGKHTSLATPICYEAILPRVCRQFAEPQLLVNVTNDAWFGDTACPHQHAMLAALRSTELGRPMFRSAYSGMSLVIEPHGHRYAITKPFTEVNRVVTVRLATFDTLYGKLGDWFVAVCFLSLAGAWLATRRKAEGSGA